MPFCSPGPVASAAAAERLTELCALGFSVQHAQLAVDSLGAAVEAGALMEWLLMSLPADLLPSQFAAGECGSSMHLSCQSPESGSAQWRHEFSHRAASKHDLNLSWQK